MTYLAKIDESTKAQMEIISKRENQSELHALQRRMKETEPLSSQYSRDERDAKPEFSSNRSASKNPIVFNSGLKTVSDVAITTVNPGNALHETPIAIIVET